MSPGIIHLIAYSSCRFLFKEPQMLKISINNKYTDTIVFSPDVSLSKTNFRKLHLWWGQDIFFCLGKI